MLGASAFTDLIDEVPIAATFKLQPWSLVKRFRAIGHARASLMFLQQHIVHRTRGWFCAPCAVSTLFFLVASSGYTDSLREETLTFAFTLVATPCSVSCLVMCTRWLAPWNSSFFFARCMRGASSSTVALDSCAQLNAAICHLETPWRVPYLPVSFLQRFPAHITCHVCGPAHLTLSCGSSRRQGGRVRVSCQWRAPRGRCPFSEAPMDT